LPFRLLLDRVSLWKSVWVAYLAVSNRNPNPKNPPRIRIKYGVPNGM
jgi:hypothetical protein